MDAQTLETWAKKIMKQDLPVHLNDLAHRLGTSPATMSKVVHSLEAAGMVKTKRCGQTWLILKVMRCT